MRGGNVFVDGLDWQMASNGELAGYLTHEISTANTLTEIAAHLPN
jgi:hypothetical protein